jgi:hypothetical protein
MSSASRRLIAKFILGCGSSIQKASASGVGANFWATTSNGVAFATSVNWPGFPWQGIQRIAASCLPLLASAENAGVAAKPANRSVHKRVIAHVTIKVGLCTSSVEPMRSFGPLAPMRRLKLDASFGQSIDPAIVDASARKNQWEQRAGCVRDRQLKITIERCACDRHPLHPNRMLRYAPSGVDLHQPPDALETRA